MLQHTRTFFTIVCFRLLDFRLQKSEDQPHGCEGEASTYSKSKKKLNCHSCMLINPLSILLITRKKKKKTLLPADV